MTTPDHTLHAGILSLISNSSSLAMLLRLAPQPEDTKVFLKFTAQPLRAAKDSTDVLEPLSKQTGIPSNVGRICTPAGAIGIASVSSAALPAP